MRLSAAICLLLFAVNVTAQDITGTWEEYSETRYTSYTKFCIIKVCDIYVCYAYDRDNDNGYCKTNLTAKFNPRSKQFWGECVSFENRTPGHVLGIYNLYYKTKRGEEMLEGLVYQKRDSLKDFFFPSRDSSGISNDKPEFIQLVKTSNQVDSSLFMKEMALKPCKTEEVFVQIPAVKKPKETNDPYITAAVMEKIVEKPSTESRPLGPPAIKLAPFHRSRLNDTISVLSIAEKEIFIRVLDNAITDGDTISIIHNGNLIAERIPVSGKPYPIRIYLSKENPYHEMVLVAHNLGSIPPNTALLLISSGDKIFRLHAIADLSKNALIVFKYTGN